ncbi:hypothetical protein EXU57_07875 [Segetibacter sp. 3557_3]|uniref:hypothetical protein n=1 Tax=Segetibacter sp. 3557_3 TaxID=2547429 RepID=UPI001058ADB6|nr:hypothetical protein [Segetibacter sp. 3557_3]TDH27489.1 hypothetical protein EXU57_07875 [Segetibacter sp. 3557_3]
MITSQLLINRFELRILLLSFVLLIGTTAFCQSDNYGSKRKMLLRDEGLSQVSYIDLADSTKNWFVTVPAGRDLQLVGNGEVLISTGNGYEVREIKGGKLVKQDTTYPGTVMVRMLRNGNLLVVGLNAQGKKGAVLAEVNKSGLVKKVLNFPEYDYVRLVRETAKGTYLVTANKMVFETDANGKIIWKANLTKGPEKTNAWQALRLANGQTVVSGGYAGYFEVFDKAGKPVSTITGPPEVKPNFFSGFQVLPNGNYVVANWQGHGPNYGGSGHQVLEYTPAGKLAWSWRQYAHKFSSLQGVIVLDGLNTNLRYIEGAKGVLEAGKKIKN